MDIKQYVNDMENNSKLNYKIKKEMWDKELRILIPVKKDVKELDRIQVFILKLIYHMDYFNRDLLITMLSPALAKSKIENKINELLEADLLREENRTQLGKYLYLTKRCIKKMTDAKGEGEYSIKKISNCTLEVQYYRQLFLTEMVIENVVNYLTEVFNKLDENVQNNYLLVLFVKNISFDLMIKLNNRDEYLRELGYTENELIRVNNIKSYSIQDREKYKKAVLSKNNKILGFNEYFEPYKNYMRSQKEIFQKYNFLFELISLKKNYDFFENCVYKTVRGKVNNKDFVVHNVVKNQTKELREGIEYLAQDSMKRNELEPIKSNTLITDNKINDYQVRLNIYKAISSNLNKIKEKYRNKEILSEEEISIYEELVEAYKRNDELIKSLQNEYNNYKKIATFNDSIATINTEEKPVIHLKALELRNVFIKNVEQKKDKSGKILLKISVVNVDNHTQIKGFRQSTIRRDYFGVCELIKNIENELGIKIFIEYIFRYPEGSNITDYEGKFERMFKNASGNSQMIGADKFIVKMLSKYIPYEEYMSGINDIFVN